jgi:hypothetical protein
MPIESLLLIVVVVEAVWILSSLFRNKEEEKARQQGRMPPRVQTVGENRPRSTPTNVDRFLEDMNRRRRESLERESTEARRLTPRRDVPRPAPRPRPTQPAVEVIVLPAPAGPGRVGPVPVFVAEAARAAPIVEARPTDTFVGSQVTTTFHGNASSPSSSQAPTSTPPNWILHHLRNRDMLRSAMVLQQVLGPPLSSHR